MGDLRRLGRLPQPLLDVIEKGRLRALHGHLLLYGTGPSCVDIVDWNEGGTWKFAWKEHLLRLHDLVCFGGTSIGDQWAIQRDDPFGPVLQLDGFELTTIRTWSSVEAFFEWFREWSEAPDDDLLAGAAERFDDLPADQLLAPVPPALFGVKDILSRLRPLPPTVAMVFGGDVYTQCNENPGRPVARMETFEDEYGRARIKLVWGGVQ